MISDLRYPILPPKMILQFSEVFFKFRGHKFDFQVFLIDFFTKKS